MSKISEIQNRLDASGVKEMKLQISHSEHARPQFYLESEDGEEPLDAFNGNDAMSNPVCIFFLNAPTDIAYTLEVIEKLRGALEAADAIVDPDMGVCPMGRKEASSIIKKALQEIDKWA